jgi:hypothetical protein
MDKLLKMCMPLSQQDCFATAGRRQILLEEANRLKELARIVTSLI